MGKYSTLFYFVDNTKKSEENNFYLFEDFIEKTDQFLNSFFKDDELKVDDKVLIKILEACK
jgi:hypothetical protein